MRERIEIVVGRRVAQARQAAGLTQAALAERCKMSPLTIGRLERGKQIPPLARLEDVARVLSTTLPDLLRRVERMTRQERVVLKMGPLLRRLPAENAELILDIAELIARRG